MGMYNDLLALEKEEEMGRLFDELMKILEEMSIIPKTTHSVRNLIISKLVEDDFMFESAIQETIEMLENGEISAAYFMLRDIHIADMERKENKAG